jgi:5'-deoxynucleotidase YfbR-like HD superfamily hydrolase
MLLDSDGGNDFPDKLKNIVSTGQEDRFRQQIEFILEVDKLKNVLRKTILIDRSRRENSAEHSWHIALMVFIFYFI